MEEPNAMEANAACSRLAQFAISDARTGSVHSVFDHAVNLEFGERLISVLAQRRGLVPYGCTVKCECAFPAMGVAQGMGARLENGRIALANGLTIDLKKALAVDLAVDSIAKADTDNASSFALQQVINLLQAEGGTDGLSVLVTDAGTNVYADILRPRLPVLFSAVQARDEAAAIAAVTRIAGCGIGLTPSSDDLLTAYFITIRLLSRFGRMRDARPLLPSLAEAAARKTNRISGAFLINSGDGLASEDFLSLLKHVFFTADAEAVSDAARRVSQFGSTSGRDMLTGLVLAIQHHDGGKNSG